MNQIEQILLKHLTNHFAEGAEVYIKDHPGLITHLNEALKETATEFARWLNRNGWQEYDQENNWICISSTNTYSTDYLFEKFNLTQK